MQYAEISFWVAQQNVADLKDLKSQVEDLASQVGGLEFQISLLKGEIRNWQSSVLFLVGVFCALWAQNTCRNAWL